MTPVTKYWVCKMTAALVCEAMECLGGNGYVEDGLVARVYREAPVNGIWEGSGNVMALDLLRVLARERDAVDMVIETLTHASRDDKAIISRLAWIKQGLADLTVIERRGRALIEGLAVVAAATILREHSPAAVADPFVATRLSGERRYSYGQGLEAADTRAIIGRALAA
jgi:putative acyl-CoA dehydrogenase